VIVESFAGAAPAEFVITAAAISRPKSIP
jgi:hypothetical protein